MEALPPLHKEGLLAVAQFNQFPCRIDTGQRHFSNQSQELFHESTSAFDSLGGLAKAVITALLILELTPEYARGSATRRHLTTADVGREQIGSMPLRAAKLPDWPTDLRRLA